MKPIKIDRMYIMDATYRRASRRSMNTVIPYTILIGIDTLGVITDEHLKYIKTENLNLEVVRTYPNLFGENITSFKYKMGPVVRSNPKDDFEFFKKIVENDASIIINTNSNNKQISEWTKLFIHLFTLE